MAKIHENLKFSDFVFGKNKKSLLSFFKRLQRDLAKSHEIFETFEKSHEIWTISTTAKNPIANYPKKRSSPIIQNSSIVDNRFNFSKQRWFSSCMVVLVDLWHWCNVSLISLFILLSRVQHSPCQRWIAKPIQELGKLKINYNKMLNLKMHFWHPLLHIP